MLQLLLMLKSIADKHPFCYKDNVRKEDEDFVLDIVGQKGVVDMLTQVRHPLQSSYLGHAMDTVHYCCAMQRLYVCNFFFDGCSW